MPDPKERRLSADGKSLSERIGTSEKLKLKAGKQTLGSIWEGFAMFGIVGWSIVLPTLAGVMAGRWLDSRFPDPQRSWTLMLMVAGLVAGCFNAWRWIQKENSNMHKEE